MSHLSFVFWMGIWKQRKLNPFGKKWLRFKFLFPYFNMNQLQQASLLKTILSNGIFFDLHQSFTIILFSTLIKTWSQSINSPNSCLLSSTGEKRRKGKWPPGQINKQINTKWKWEYLVGPSRESGLKQVKAKLHQVIIVIHTLYL